jgi:drug/metabolite transporter (DMT)-like permease
VTYFLAVLAACANATSSVLQRKANLEVPQNQNLSLRLIWSLLHKPVWFGGILAICIGFLLQATALGFGQLSVVEPVLILELPLTLILGSRVFHQRMGHAEWWPVAVLAAGLAALLFLLSPSSGRSGGVSWYLWTAGIGANLMLIAALVLWGKRHRPESRGSGARRGSGSYRAALLGVAAGSGFGLTAALMKGMTQTYSHGITVLFTSWQLYAMIASGLLGMFLTQSAMNAGRLVATQPGITLSDPVVSVMWGVLAFGEQVRGGWYGVLAGICAVVTAGAVLALARSPLLSGSSPEDKPESRPAHEKLRAGHKDG